MRLLVTALLLPLAFTLTGCDDEPPPRPAAQATIPKPGSAPDVLAPADDAPEVAYAYSPIGKRDPFRSFFEEFQDEAASEETTELQKFEVDQLRLTAIITGRATPYSMVEDPKGKGHTLTRGTLIGKNWGRVATITPECVIIKEEYRDYTGRKVTNTISMCLPKEDELKLD